MKKLIFWALVVTSSVAITSCVKTEVTTELQIISNCAGNICNVEIVEVQLEQSTNMLGKTTERVLSKNILPSSSFDITWSTSTGDLADASDMSDENLPPCGNDGNCSYDSNPTGFDFGAGGTFLVSIKGKQIYPDGTTRPINETSSVDVPGNDPDAPNTQLTFSGGDYSAFDENSGTATASGISWLKNGTDITFTCPSGYAVPNAVTGPISGTNDTTLTNSNGNTPVVTLGSDTISGVEYTVDKQARDETEAWYWQNHEDWNTYMTCVPGSEIDNYS